MSVSVREPSAQVNTRSRASKTIRAVMFVSAARPLEKKPPASFQSHDRGCGKSQGFEVDAYHSGPRTRPRAL